MWAGLQRTGGSPLLAARWTPKPFSSIGGEITVKVCGVSELNQFLRGWRQ
ncbi:MAG: hypothetical protein ACR2FG_07855 [Marmoricola sp.]